MAHVEGRTGTAQCGLLALPYWPGTLRLCGLAGRHRSEVWSESRSKGFCWIDIPWRC